MPRRNPAREIAELVPDRTTLPGTFIPLGPAETRGVLPPYMLAVAPPHPLQRHLVDIERMSAQGMDALQIARRLGISEFVFADAALRFEDVALALTGGAARLADETSAQMRRNALSGDTAALSFLLKSKAGFTTTQVVAIAPAPQGPQEAPITLDHVDAMAARQRALLGRAREAEGS